MAWSEVFAEMVFCSLDEKESLQCHVLVPIIDIVTSILINETQINWCDMLILWRPSNNEFQSVSHEQ